MNINAHSVPHTPITSTYTPIHNRRWVSFFHTEERKQKSFNWNVKSSKFFWWIRTNIWLHCAVYLYINKCFNFYFSSFISISLHRNFGAKCSKCCRGISSSDWVRRARELVFHLACFACDSCGRQLSTGEQFALLDDRVLCKAHYLETIDGGTTSSDGKFNQRFAIFIWIGFYFTLATSPIDGCDADGYHKSKAKRVRTTFTEEQLQVLQANFQIDSNPDGQDLERIASVTGLSKRVTQVWFQNSRARQKKHIHSGDRLRQATQKRSHF